MYVFDPTIDEYSARYSSAEPEVLAELSRITHLRTLQPRMLSGQVQGRFLGMMAGLMNAGRILEIGTFTGYSAIALAQGMPDGGKLISIDINDEVMPIAREAIAKAGLQERIELITGDAAHIMPTLEGPFDLIFIDADKRNYARYYQLALPLLRKGGLILADNVLWSGRVFDPQIRDADTEALRSFSELVQHDERVDNVLLTLRDGLLMIVKR
ncbi:MAG: class I SAM-dependent methyltransferase [Bacteroidia bacterium]|jgi:predicted O-methyltransferase YrrM|nr:class I SAM-dependent methyltransferase [Bacteroidia bacterium]